MLFREYHGLTIGQDASESESVPGIRGVRLRRPRARLRSVRLNCKRGTAGQTLRGAGGSRTRFCGFADRRLAVRLRRPECFDTPSEGHVLARNRTWSSTFARSCARPSHSEDNDRNTNACESPTRESNPALRLRRPPCVRHTRGERAQVPLPGVEPGPRPSEGRVPSVTLQGRNRSRRPDSNRHDPAYKAGAWPFGHVGKSRAQGFEPCPRVLEARCSPRSTPL